VVLAGTAAWAQSPLKVGTVKPYLAETPHPYPLGSEARPVVWTDRVVSPGAEFVRVHFSGLNLAPGDYVTVSSPDGAQVWTYTGAGPRWDGDVWAFAIDGDTVIVQIHGGRGRGHGYRIDAVGHGEVRLDTRGPGPVPEVVCSTDGREDAACHMRDAVFDAAQAPVARLLFASGAYLYVCTGWLARGANDSTLVTNNHCISRQREADSLQAMFNFQFTKCGGNVVAPTATYAGGLLLRTNNIRKHGHKDGLDYTLLTLMGNAEAAWGELVPTTKPTAVGDPIWFIQHPGGREKKVGFYEDADHAVLCKLDAVDQSIKGVAPSSQNFYACDSEGGSSGSPIVDPATGHVIALHHFGGITSDPCLNGGTEMPEICADAGPLLECAAD
jgi:hypothetical protein